MDTYRVAKVDVLFHSPDDFLRGFEFFMVLGFDFAAAVYCTRHWCIDTPDQNETVSLDLA